MATGLAVLTGGIRPFGGLTGETGKVSQAPRHPQSGTAVARHKSVERQDGQELIKAFLGVRVQA